MSEAFSWAHKIWSRLLVPSFPARSRRIQLPGTTIYQNNRNNRITGIITEIPGQPTIYRNNQEKYQNNHYCQTLYDKIHEKWIIILIHLIIYWFRLVLYENVVGYISLMILFYYHKSHCLNLHSVVHWKAFNLNMSNYLFSFFFCFSFWNYLYGTKTGRKYFMGLKLEESKTKTKKKTKKQEDLMI